MSRLEPPSRRRSARRPSRARILVVCGGERTEPTYLKGLRDSLNNRAVDIKVLSKGRAPAQVVGYAVAQWTPDFDEVWCVLDVDEFDLAEAIGLAREHGINLAVSNPCFELWLLLHHADCRTHCAGYRGVTRHLKRHVPTYDKTRLDYVDYAPGVANAVRRAKDLDPTGSEYRKNPSTSVWRLVELLLES